MRIGLLIVFFMVTSVSVAQNISIHQEQSLFYKKHGQIADSEKDSLNGFVQMQINRKAISSLKKRVFGYHPYWIGNVWQNYRWDLLSDLCYFSYDTDPATGNPITTNGFETAAVIDTALAYGVKVHLCVTLFSDHSLFFSNPQAKTTLISNILYLLIHRGASGVNIDFEAVPSSQKDAFTDFLLQLSDELHNVIPDAELSIAAPAVNWNNTLNIPAISQKIDLFMIMAYDYYWNGSDVAGPVSGLWPLTSSFNYAVNHTLCYYQSQGIPGEKILLGVPYYGREWPVTANTLPASATGNGSALTYRNIRDNNNGFYIPSNLYWDNRSFNPYYSYFNNNWRQCFFDDIRSLGAKYDLINRRNTGGIGIWALGYDNGYNDLWNLISEKFANEPNDACRDTLFDSGGPAWNHHDNETYTETVFSEFPGPLKLNFHQFDLESGYDSLFIYNGADINFPMIAVLSGNQIPDDIYTTANSFTIRFKSDGATTRAGYSVVWSCPSALVDDFSSREFTIFPNPANDFITISSERLKNEEVTVNLYNINGIMVYSGQFGLSDKLVIPVNYLSSGFYILKISANGWLYSRKLIINHY